MPGIFTCTKEEISHHMQYIRVGFFWFYLKSIWNKISIGCHFKYWSDEHEWISIWIRQHSRRHSIFHVNMKGLAPFLPTLTLTHTDVSCCSSFSSPFRPLVTSWRTRGTLRDAHFCCNLCRTPAHKRERVRTATIIWYRKSCLTERYNVSACLAVSRKDSEPLDRFMS